MEQIIGIILTLLISGIYAVAKERKRKKSETMFHAPEDFPDTRRKSAVPPVPVFPEIAKMPSTLPVEGARVTADIPESHPEYRPEDTDDAIAAHRERWRRAIIDSEILSRKF